MKSKGGSKSRLRAAAGVLSLVVFCGLLSCEKEKPQGAAQPAREHPLQRDGTAARVATSTIDRVRVLTDIAAVRSALRAWHSQHGGYPAKIEDLNLEGLKYPADIVYDSSKGTVKSATYPEL